MKVRSKLALFLYSDNFSNLSSSSLLGSLIMPLEKQKRLVGLTSDFHVILPIYIWGVFHQFCMSSEEQYFQQQYCESQERYFHIFSVEKTMQYCRVYYKLGIAFITITSIIINAMTCELFILQCQSLQASPVALNIKTSIFCWTVSYRRGGEGERADYSASCNILFIFTAYPG